MIRKSNNPIIQSSNHPILIVGLGNPGKKYQKTRHNLGFRVIDALEKYSALPARVGAPTPGEPSSSDLASESEPPDVLGSASFKSHSTVFFKPQSFMNLSGSEVLKKLNYYRLKPEDLIVIHDDIDLPFGKIRIRKSGRSGGHKGVKSLIDTLGTQNFNRVKIGIGRPPKEIDAEDYVLENFSPSEEKSLPKIIDQAVEKVIELISKC